MKTLLRFTALIVLLSPLVLLAEKGPAPSYPLTVHVVSSRYLVVPSGLGDMGASIYDEVHVVIDGEKYVLAADIIHPKKQRLLLPGDYKARLIKNKPPTAYEIDLTYEFLFPDGNTMKFYLEGVGE